MVVKWSQFFTVYKLSAGLYMIHSEECRLEQQESEVIEMREEFNDSADIESCSEINQNEVHYDHSQNIIVDQDTLGSNDLLNVLQTKQQTKAHDKFERQKEPLVDDESKNEGKQKWNICKKLAGKLTFYAFDNQPMEHSYNEFEANEKRYLERMKIVYSHFLLKDRRLTLNQIHHLKAILYVPKCGESLVRWGSSRYGGDMTVTMALERLNHFQKLASQPCSRQRCKEDARLICCLLLLLLIIKMMA